MTNKITIYFTAKLSFEFYGKQEDLKKIVQFFNENPDFESHWITKHINAKKFLEKPYLYGFSRKAKQKKAEEDETE